MTPSEFCAAGATGAMTVLSRSISDGRTFVGWLRPGTPVRNTCTRSLRGVARRRHAEQRLDQHRQRRIRHVAGELPVVPRLAAR